MKKKILVLLIMMLSLGVTINASADENNSNNNSEDNNIVSIDGEELHGYDLLKENLGPAAFEDVLKYFEDNGLDINSVYKVN